MKTSLRVFCYCLQLIKFILGKVLNLEKERNKNTLFSKLSQFIPGVGKLQSPGHMQFASMQICRQKKILNLI